MNKLLTAAVLLVAMTFLAGPASAGAILTMAVQEHTTLNGNPGTVIHETFEEDGFTESMDFFIIQEDGKHRLYGLREEGSDIWEFFPDAYYVVPVSSMTIGQTWVGLPGEDWATTTYTVGVIETITVPAGIFPNAYRVDKRLASQAPDSQPFESEWYVNGAGRVYGEQYNEDGTIDFYTELTSYSVSGSGFFPEDLGNTWEYEETVVFPSPVNDQEMPVMATLANAYPNPFNPSTQLAFELTESGPVRLGIYDATGRLITTLVDEHRADGHHEVTWNGRDNSGRLSPAGVYLYRLEHGSFSETKRMTLVK